MNIVNNYSGTSGSLWQSKKDEPAANNGDLTVDNSQSFKYKAARAGETEDAVNNTKNPVKSTKIVVPLNYLSNFCSSLEILLTNCKTHLELN